MKEFCKNCEHRKIPKSIKNKYTHRGMKIKFLCPMSIEKIYGCTVKFLEIDWGGFVTLLLKEKQLTEKEVLELKILGWKFT